MNLLGSLAYPEELSDIWGYEDTLGNEYAIVGVYNGVSVVDITNPANPNELWFFPGAGSIWRDMKTWNKHAYVTNESDGGLFIIDLSNLPDTATPTTASFTGNSFTFTSAHNLYIDENGVGYIFGANHGSGGAIFLDLTQDPLVPVELGLFDDYYIHDGMARGDTLWASHISNGFQSAIDVTSKSSPVMLSNWNTPNNFTHNCWISDDGNYIFTTDEKSGAYVASYDVSDINNVSELDRIQSNTGSGVIPHNTHYLDGFVITSYYRDGVTIHDVSRPGNMVEVGNYDSYTQGQGDGFNGDWGAYPWLSSGNIIISDIENGLFILGPNYVRACFLEGTITDQVSSNPIANATATILTTSASDDADISGFYATGVADSGTYQVVYAAPGYISDTVTTTLSNGVLTIVDVQLGSLPAFSLTGQVLDFSTGDPIENALVLIESNDFTFNETTDVNGNFSIPTFFAGIYDVIAGQWGYVTNCTGNNYINANTNTLEIYLGQGIYDDFTFDFGWTVTGDASDGVWERGVPYGTSYQGEEANPQNDLQSDCSNAAYVTGNGNGVAVNEDDVDDGTTTLTSPMFNLIGLVDPYIEYSRWFFNAGGFGQTDDTLKISITNGTQVVPLEIVTDTANSEWVFTNVKVSDYITPAATMQLIVETADLQNGHLVEAAIDGFRVVDSGAVSIHENVQLASNVVAYPNPFDNGLNISYSFNELPKESFLILHDIMGREKYRLTLTEISGTITLGQDLSSGMYFVSLVNRGVLIESTKVIKK
jgi:choice-of-anchor B domain-containing protein